MVEVCEGDSEDHQGAVRDADQGATLHFLFFLHSLTFLLHFLQEVYLVVLMKVCFELGHLQDLIDQMLLHHRHLAFDLDP